MQKVICSIIVLVSLLVVPLYPVYAVDVAPRRVATPSAKLATRSGELKPPKPVLAREILEKRMGNVASQAAEFKARLAKFRDKTKAKRVESVNENLDKINQKRTEMMTSHLDMMLKLLDKVEAKANEASASGQVNTGGQAITDAKNYINKVKVSVEEQAAKSYIIEVNTETTVKADAKETRNTLHQDLKTLHEQIVEARSMVSKAIKATFPNLGGQSGQ